MKTPDATEKAMLRIDPEFRAYIPALSDDERALLEQNLAAEGCRDPLVVWGDLLIDGHNRYEICTRLGLEFSTVQREFADREAALDWMDAHQLGRRNLSPDARRLLLGRRYNRLKLSRAEAGALGGASTGQSDHCLDNTAEKLAREHGVSEATVRRAGSFARQVEVDPEAKAALEAGKRLPKRPAEPAAPGDGADELPEAPQNVIRRAVDRLTNEAKIDEIIGLRAHLEEVQDELAKVKVERDQLKSKLAEATQGDMGRALGNAQRRADTATGRMNEYMATVKRLEFRLKKAEARVAELEDVPVQMDAA